MSQHMHNPGSAEAVGRGCTCDFIKNDFGRGQAGPDGAAFYCSETCPVHGALLAITSPQTDTDRIPTSDETSNSLKWLKSQMLRPRKRPPTA
jgi:hypothetical protein